MMSQEEDPQNILQAPLLAYSFLFTCLVILVGTALGTDINDLCEFAFMIGCTTIMFWSMFLCCRISRAQTEDPEHILPALIWTLLFFWICIFALFVSMLETDVVGFFKFGSFIGLGVIPYISRDVTLEITGHDEANHLVVTAIAVEEDNEHVEARQEGRDDGNAQSAVVDSSDNQRLVVINAVQGKSKVYEWGRNLSVAHAADTFHGNYGSMDECIIIPTGEEHNNQERILSKLEEGRVLEVANVTMTDHLVQFACVNTNWE
eukprot:CAMPEP_0183715160 /NCGR_PEP_ID=MMETSP0737-20130205/9499_1 /TAXON_ID=385413 /ORGANISM="Thalassiosira miniscula, Strain CCMP1093" /LENGTH=261 /DNA_ID=CAMNT_0025944243 /DNA_START=115 /DNA_END=901 /DNA_ORIENTATION=+